MNISVVIPTYMRASYLLQTIEEVLGQDHDALMEIIVIDQTPKELITINLQKKIKGFSNRLNIIYIHREEPNLPAARNYGLSIARGEIVIMLDDDVLLPSDFLAAHYNTYLENKQAIFVVGQPHHRMTQHLESISEIDIYNFRQYTSPHFKAIERDDDWKGLAVGANHSMLKSYGIATQGYDEQMIGTSFYEDSDFIKRLRKAFPDGHIVFNPDAYLIHLRAPTGGCRIPIAESKIDWQITFSAHLYLWRHTSGIAFWKLMGQTLRIGPLRRENILQPWKQPQAWFGFIKSLRKSFSKKRLTVSSSLFEKDNI